MLTLIVSLAVALTAVTLAMAVLELLYSARYAKLFHVKPSVKIRRRRIS